MGNLTNYCGDIPHQIKCNKCNKYFWTGSHRSYGECNACGGNIEMDAKYANDLLDEMGFFWQNFNLNGNCNE